VTGPSRQQVNSHFKYLQEAHSSRFNLISVCPNCGESSAVQPFLYKVITLVLCVQIFDFVLFRLCRIFLMKFILVMCSSTTYFKWVFTNCDGFQFDCLSPGTMKLLKGSHLKKQCYQEMYPKKTD